MDLQLLKEIDVHSFQQLANVTTMNVLGDNLPDGGCKFGGFRGCNIRRHLYPLAGSWVLRRCLC